MHRALLQDRAEAKGQLDAPHIVLAPVALRHLLLAHGHAAPLDAHDRHAVDVVLVKVDAQRRVVTRRPLLQAPALHNVRGLLELDVGTGDVAVKQLKLAADLGALKQLGRRAREGGDALRVGESLVQLVGRGAELFLVGDRCGVDGLAGGRLGCGGRRVRLGGGAGGREVFGGGEAARRVGPRGVLDVLAMLGNKGTGQLDEGLAQLGHQLAADKVLDGLLALAVGVNVDFKLTMLGGCSKKIGLFQEGKGELTTNSSSSVSWATSGMVMEPLTSSSPGAAPVYSNTSLTS